MLTSQQVNKRLPVSSLRSADWSTQHEQRWHSSQASTTHLQSTHLPPRARGDCFLVFAVVCVRFRAFRNYPMS